MKKKILCLILLGLTIVSCGKNKNSSESSSSSIESTSSSVNENQKFTVTWKDENGNVLETDNDVALGSLPTYAGTALKKEKSDNTYYFFAGWNPSIEEVTSDVTYTAKFIELHTTGTKGKEPVISEDGKTVYYGFYPQTNVKDQSIISQLETLTPNSNGWVEYSGEYYTKEKANVYNNETYKFDNGTTITHGSSYWFKCEPIQWNILSGEDGHINLVSTMLLDTSKYYDNYLNRTIDEDLVYSNNYKESTVRSFLNGEFYDKAFSINNSYVKEVVVSNSGETTDSNNNEYVSENTQDKVYLASYRDYLNSSYGFESTNGLSTSRSCKTTDYTRARGAWLNPTSENLNCSTYWTRSATSQYYYCAWNVNSAGYLSTYAVDGSNHCIRPCISIG